MKKILFVGDAGSIHIAKYVNYFVHKEGYDVCVATFSKNNCTDCQNIMFLSDRNVTSGGGNYHYLLSVFKLAMLIRKYYPDYINAHFSYSMGFIALLAMKLSGINAKFSVVCHGSDIMAYPYKWCFLLNKIVLPMYKRLLAWNISSKKIFMGQYGVEIEKKELVKRDIDIISIRDASPNSQIEFMLEALAQINGILQKKIVFVIPGIDHQKLENLRNTYPHIIFYKKLNHSDILELLVRSKVYISATKSDGTALSLLEAMVYGAYPVVSDISTNICWIKDSINGRLFKNKCEFIENVSYAMNLPDMDFEKIRRINCALVDCKCNYSKQMKKIEEFLFK